MATAYKARKEAFVSNLSGSSLTEINLVTLVAGSAVFLWTALQKKQSFFTPYTPLAATVDFLLNVCAILFAITIYSSAPILLNIFLVTPALFLLWSDSGSSTSGSRSRSHSRSAAKSKPAKLSSGQLDSRKDNHPLGFNVPRLPVRPFLTHYRGSMLVVTCLAILAVDFPVFPRRFAKVETWGTSLMDLGVGSFVFSAGVVSARAVFKGEQAAPSTNSNTGTMTTTTTTTTTTFTTHLIQSIRHSIPLLLLGFIRLWSVKGLDYAEHVTEYGVHWNFFFTLALLPPFVEVSDLITRKLFKTHHYDAVAILLALTYEFILDKTDLLKYIVSAPRGPDLLSMNREGVFSFTGYLAIFLAGRGTGVRVIPFRGVEAAEAIRGGLGTQSRGDTNKNDNNNDTIAEIDTTTSPTTQDKDSNHARTPNPKSPQPAPQPQPQPQPRPQTKPPKAQTQTQTQTHPPNQDLDSLSPIDLTRHDRRLILRDLLVQCGIYTTLYLISTDFHLFNLNVSRRLANLPYVLWVAAFNNAQILLFGIIEAYGAEFAYLPQAGAEAEADAEAEEAAGAKARVEANAKPTERVEANAKPKVDERVKAYAKPKTRVTPKPKWNPNPKSKETANLETTPTTTSPILAAFNRNGLPVFLVANLLTGLVNLTLNTLDMPALGALGVLLAYAACVAFVAVALDGMGVRIRI